MDCPDRLFHSVAEAWRGVTGGSMGDVKELIPELYCAPELLVNADDVPLGTRQVLIVTAVRSTHIYAFLHTHINACFLHVNVWHLPAWQLLTGDIHIDLTR